MNLWIWFWVAAVVVVLLVAFKFKEIKHKFGLVTITIILIFLVFSFMQVYRTNNVDLSTFDGVTAVGKLYFSWLGNMFGNLANIGGYAIHQNWGINLTNSTGK